MVRPAGDLNDARLLLLAPNLDAKTREFLGISQEWNDAAPRRAVVCCSTAAGGVSCSPHRPISKLPKRVVTAPRKHPAVVGDRHEMFVPGSNVENRKLSNALIGERHELTMLRRVV
jgi:hypothetical protein